MTLFGSDVVLYKPQYHYEHGKHINLGTRIGVIKEYNIHEFHINDIQANSISTYKNYLYVIGESGKVKVFDRKYNFVKEMRFKKNMKSCAIRDVKFREGNMYIAYLYKDLHIEICKYNIETADLLDKSTVIIPENIKWKYEAFAFYPVGN